MGDAFDLSLFGLPMIKLDDTSDFAAPMPTPPQSTRASVGQRITGEEFLAGPIRMAWIEAAARLPGAALSVALMVRHLHVMRGKEWVVLSNAAMKPMGISPSAKARAVKALEGAALIEVDKRQNGQAPRVQPLGDR